LRAQPAQPAERRCPPGLLRHLHQRPQPLAAARFLPQRATPATTYQARPKATPGDRTTHAHHRVRADIIDTNGTVTLRHSGRLYHIGIGRTYVLLLTQDTHVRVIHATGELLRELTLDPTRNYQPTGKPRRPKKKTP
jgi:hypothetical protein